MPSAYRATPEGPLTRLRSLDGSDVPYGSIRFAGSKRAPSKWVSISKESSVEDVYDLLVDTWQLERPPVVIAVTGAAASVPTLKAKDKAIFERGLRTAVRKTSAWVITGGTNAGVMKMVGAIMAKEPAQQAPVVLGIVPVGCVMNHEEMVAPANKGKIFAYPKSEITNTKVRASLDPNHSHFVLVDDGTVGKFGGEREMRVAIEDKICEPVVPHSIYDERLPTPMVLLVLGGGVGTLDVIIRTLEKWRPVIVLAESGGVATQIYNYMKKGELPELSTKLKDGEPENKREVEVLKAKLPIVKKLGEELKGANKREQLTFFHTGDGFEEENDLDQDILSAILSDCETTEEAIRHAVKWSDPETIDEQLQISRQIDADGLVRAFQTALIMGCESEAAKNVVRTLIEYNADARLVRFNRLFSGENLDQIDIYGVISRFKNKEKQKKKGLFSTNKVGDNAADGIAVGSAMSIYDEIKGFDLLEDILEPMGFKQNLECRALAQSVAQQKERAGIKKTSLKRSINDNKVPPNWTDLMMWAVAVGQPDIARMLWKKTREPLRAGIMAARLAAQIKDDLGPDSLELDEVEEQSKLYEKWAAGVIDKVEDYHEAITLLTMVGRKKYAGNDEPKYVWRDSVMDQACNDDHSQKFFVSRKNCQRLLKNYYNGDHSASYAKIDNHTPTWKLLIQIVLNLSVICTLGILAPIVKCVTIVPTKPVEGYALDDDDVDDDDDDDDDWDDEYFKRPEAKAVGRWEGYKFPFYKDFELLLHFFYIPRVKFINHTCKQLRAPPASKAACTHTYKLSLSHHPFCTLTISPSPTLCQSSSFCTLSSTSSTSSATPLLRTVGRGNIAPATSSRPFRTTWTKRSSSSSFCGSTSLAARSRSSSRRPSSTTPRAAY